MNNPKSTYAYVGIDSHKKTHYAVVINCYFETIEEMEFDNIHSGFDSFLKRLEKLEQEGYTLVFGLEDISAYGKSLVLFLKKYGYIVKHVNAQLVAKERGDEKSDRIDAECVAKLLFSRFDKLPIAHTQEIYSVFNEIVTGRRTLVKNNKRLKNSLHILLTDNYTDYDKFFTNIDCKMSLAFFEKYPSPSLLEGVTVEEIRDLLIEASNNKQWKGKAEKILNIIQAKSYTTSAYQSISNFQIRTIIQQIRQNKGEIDRIEPVLKQYLDIFGYKLQSMNGIDTVTAAEFVAEIGDISRFQSANHLASYAGIAPVKKSSGQNDKMRANKHGNRVLNSLFYNLAIRVTMEVGKNKVYVNQCLREYYDKWSKLENQEQSKHLNRQAIKRVERRLVNIIYSMMKNKCEYINPPTMQSN